MVRQRQNWQLNWILPIKVASKHTKHYNYKLQKYKTLHSKKNIRRVYIGERAIYLLALIFVGFISSVSHCTNQTWIKYPNICDPIFNSNGNKCRYFQLAKHNPNPFHALFLASRSQGLALGSELKPYFFPFWTRCNMACDEITTTKKQYQEAKNVDVSMRSNRSLVSGYGKQLNLLRETPNMISSVWMLILRWGIGIGLSRRTYGWRKVLVRVINGRQ